MQPAAVLDLRLVGAGIVGILAGDGDALGNDGLGSRRNDLVVGAAGLHHVVAEAMELLIFAVAHDQAVLVVPQHEGFGDVLNRVAQSGVGVCSAGDCILVGEHRHTGEVRLFIGQTAGDVAAQAYCHPMAVGVPQPEALIEEGDSLAKVAVELRAQVVVRMQRLSQDAKGHSVGGRLQAEQAVHRRGPVHVAAREVPTPDAAAG